MWKWLMKHVLGLVQLPEVGISASLDLLAASKKKSFWSSDFSFAKQFWKGSAIITLIYYFQVLVEKKIGLHSSSSKCIFSALMGMQLPLCGVVVFPFSPFTLVLTPMFKEQAREKAALCINSKLYCCVQCLWRRFSLTKLFFFPLSWIDANS